MTLKYSAQRIILRSVELKNLPPQVLEVSPRATVPSLAFDQQNYIDESWDIMKWALKQNDPQNWLGPENEYLSQTEQLVQTNDFVFKQNLDLYKYAERHPEHSEEYYRLQCLTFIEQLNHLLENNQFLLSQSISIADIAIFPFIRQFAMVDKAWFDHSPYHALQQWLSGMMDTEWFVHSFKKHKIWHSGDEDIYI